MSLIDWQWVATLLMVAAAVLILLRRTWRLFRTSGQHGCGAGCSTCENSSQPQQEPVSRPFVSLESLGQIKASPPSQPQKAASDRVAE